VKEEDSSNSRVKDFLDSIRLQIHERLSSPLLGSFVVSWLIWNYRMLFVLFSAMTVEERFDYIDHDLYPTAFSFWTHRLGGPLICAVLYVFAYPRIAKFVQKIWLPQQVKLKEERDVIFHSKLLTPVERDRVLDHIARVRREAREQVQRLRDELEVATQDAKMAAQEAEASGKQQAAMETLDALRKKVDELETKMKRDVYFDPEATVADVVNHTIPLSDEAKELLLTAEAEKEEIFVAEYMGGSAVNVGKRKFISNNDPRTRAVWKAAVEELIHGGYVAREGNRCELTRRGFEAADIIKSIKSSAGMSALS
jgi:hypothetical protein